MLLTTTSIRKCCFGYEDNPRQEARLWHNFFRPTVNSIKIIYIERVYNIPPKSSRIFSFPWNERKHTHNQPTVRSDITQSYSLNFAEYCDKTPKKHPYITPTSFVVFITVIKSMVRRHEEQKLSDKQHWLIEAISDTSLRG